MTGKACLSRQVCGIKAAECYNAAKACRAGIDKD